MMSRIPEVRGGESFAAFWAPHTTGSMHCSAEETMVEVAFHYNGIALLTYSTMNCSAEEIMGEVTVYCNGVAC